MRRSRQPDMRLPQHLVNHLVVGQVRVRPGAAFANLPEANGQRPNIRLSGDPFRLYSGAGVPYRLRRAPSHRNRRRALVVVLRVPGGGETVIAKFDGQVGGELAVSAGQIPGGKTVNFEFESHYTYRLSGLVVKALARDREGPCSNLEIGNDFSEK